MWKMAAHFYGQRFDASFFQLRFRDALNASDGLVPYHRNPRQKKAPFVFVEYVLAHVSLPL